MTAHDDMTPFVIEQCGSGPWWWACCAPERAPDDWVLWYWECDACYLHMIVAERAGCGPHETHGPMGHIGKWLGLGSVNDCRSSLGLPVYEVER